MPRPRFERLDPERRGAVLDAAATEFAARGYDGASYNRIIERSGVSKGAMYYYFEDKADLYATVLGHALEGLGERIGDLDGETMLLPPGHVSLEVEDPLESGETECRLGETGPRAVLAVDDDGLVGWRGDLVGAAHDRPERDVDRAWNAALRELSARPQ